MPHSRVRWCWWVDVVTIQIDNMDSRVRGNDKKKSGDDEERGDDDFGHPAPETHETWEQRLERSFGRLQRGDVIVVANRHALGRAPEEEARTIASLRSRGVVVKVLRHGATHLTDVEV